MEIILIELVLWAGFAVLFWVLRDKMKQQNSGVGPNPEQTGINANEHGVVRFDRADELTEPIGTYQDAPIYLHARIGARNYVFSYVCAPEMRRDAQPDQRYLSPGLVYQPG